MLEPEVFEALDREFTHRAGFSLTEHCVYLCRVGSSAHNTKLCEAEYGAVADDDLFGVVVPPMARAVGLHPWKETVSFEMDGTDLTVHSLGKYIRLLLKANPTMLETLWVRDEDVLHEHEAFEPLRSNRKLFSTTSAWGGFAGYASQQLRKMSTAGPTGRLGAKRKALITKNGFDTKNGAHLLRLLLMCAEYMKTGELQVYRTGESAQYLRDVKAGVYTLDQVQSRAEDLFDAARAARDASTLPPTMDEDSTIRVEEMLLSAYRSFWS